MVKMREDYEVGKEVSSFIDRTKNFQTELKSHRTCRLSVYVTEEMNDSLKAISKMQGKNLARTIADLLDEILKQEEYQKILKAYSMAKEFMK